MVGNGVVSSCGKRVVILSPSVGVFLNISVGRRVLISVGWTVVLPDGSSVVVEDGFPVVALVDSFGLTLGVVCGELKGVEIV